MRPIPPGVSAAIKKRSMIGTKLPTHRVLIGDDRLVFGDESPDVEYTDDSYRPPRVIQGYNGESNQQVSNWVETSDGRNVCAWTEYVEEEQENRVVLGFVENHIDYLTYDYPVEETLVTDITVETLERVQVSLFRNDDGEILLFLKDRRGDLDGMKLDCYKSESGNGDDFEHFSNVYTNAHDPSRGYGEIHARHVSIPIKTEGGRLIIACGGSYYVSWVWGSMPTCMVFISDDGGASWKRTLSARRFNWANSIGQPVQLPDGTVFVEYQESSGANYVFRSDTEGSTWTNVTPDIEDQFRYNFSDANRGDSRPGGVWSGSFYYDVINDVVFRVVPGTYSGCGIYYLENPSRDNFLDKSAWTYAVYIHSNNMTNPRIWMTETRELAISLVRGYRTEILAMTEPRGEPIPAKSINITKNRGGAADATVVFDNSDGKYSPDRSGEYQHVMWPNKRMIVQQGYGDDLAETIQSLMDRITMETFPQRVTIRARDLLKRALDQTVTSLDGKRSVKFTNRTVEDIFTTLAHWAGFYRVMVEPTGVEIPEFTVSWESYGDAFEELAEIVGFEFYCNEDGELLFHEDTDRQPEAQETHVLNGEEWVELGESPAVTFRDRVYSADGETQYQRFEDYYIEYGFEEPYKARIRRIEGGAIGDGDTVQVRYVYPAWVFQEGKDIIGLEYQISDDDLYSEIKVFGGTPEGQEEQITATARPGNEGYYNVLRDKVMPVHANEITTQEGVQEIADRTAKQIRVKGRRVNFTAIGIPHLQVGDCIQVIEYSTTVSEIYRITEMTLTQDADGLQMQIECYHYGPAYQPDV